MRPIFCRFAAPLLTAGMGHIFLEVVTANGTLYGAWEQTNADGTPVASGAGAHGAHGSHSQAGGAPEVVAAAADGHDHAGHTPRRLLAA